jgi:isopentenyldiphosphate isomerase
MIKKNTISVWLIMEDGQNMGKIVLQRRSPEEKNYPYIYQSSWAGKIEPGENNMAAIKRECAEELGNIFHDNFDFSKLIELKKSSSIKGDIEWVCFNYFGKVNENLLNKVKMHDDAYSEFIFVNDDNLVYSVKSGKDPKNNIVLFDDQYEILKNIFDKSC